MPPTARAMSDTSRQARDREVEAPAATVAYTAVTTAPIARPATPPSSDEHGLRQELQADVAPGRAEGPPHADLAAPLEHRDHHHVGDADAADEQRHRAEAEQQRGERLVGGRAFAASASEGRLTSPRSAAAGWSSRGSTSRTSSTRSGSVRT